MQIWRSFPKLAEFGKRGSSVIPLHHRNNQKKGVWESNTRIEKTFLRFAEIRKKWQTQEEKQEAPEDEDNRPTHSSGGTNRIHY